MTPASPRGTLRQPSSIQARESTLCNATAVQVPALSPLMEVMGSKGGEEPPPSLHPQCLTARDGLAPGAEGEAPRIRNPRQLIPIYCNV